MKLYVLTTNDNKYLGVFTSKKQVIEYKKTYGGKIYQTEGNKPLTKLEITIKEEFPLETTICKKIDGTKYSHFRGIPDYTVLEVCFNGEKNFMTPHVLDITSVNNITCSHRLIFELSTGEGMFHQDLYGVTVILYVENTGEIYKTNYGKSFDNRKDARQYINQMKKDFKDFKHFKHFNHSICL